MGKRQLFPCAALPYKTRVCSRLAFHGISTTNRRLSTMKKSKLSKYIILGAIAAVVATFYIAQKGNP